MLNYLQQQIAPLKLKVTGSQKMIEAYINQLVSYIGQKVEEYERALNAMDTHTILKRGFAILQKEGKGITSVKELAIGDNFDTLLFDGKINSLIKNITPYKKNND